MLHYWQSRAFPTRSIDLILRSAISCGGPFGTHYAVKDFTPDWQLNRPAVNSSMDTNCTLPSSKILVSSGESTPISPLQMLKKSEADRIPLVYSSGTLHTPECSSTNPHTLLENR